MRSRRLASRLESRLMSRLASCDGAASVSVGPSAFVSVGVASLLLRRLIGLLVEQARGVVCDARMLRVGFARVEVLWWWRWLGCRGDVRGGGGRGTGGYAVEWR